MSTELLMNRPARAALLLASLVLAVASLSMILVPTTVAQRSANESPAITTSTPFDPARFRIAGSAPYEPPPLILDAME